MKRGSENATFRNETLDKREGENMAKKCCICETILEEPCPY